jgi:16S rRNA (cytosine967-C5)-methyltransferase
VLDAADTNAIADKLSSRTFDGIICDVPCTGSGTWARTPESLYFFDPATLNTYTERGETILRNAVDYLKPDGRLIYITCSVFHAENEAVVEKVAKEKGLHIEQMQLINGIEQKADCLFVAVLKQA